MVRKIIITGLILVLVFTFACRKEDPVTSNYGFTNNVLLSANTEGVSVLIFKRNDDNKYKFFKEIISGWSDQNRVGTQLEIGKYKFLFIKSPGINTLNSPENRTDTLSIESLRIYTRVDNSNLGFVLPVDDIWMPKTYARINTIYDIDGYQQIIKDTLQRAYTQVEIYLKRASSDGITRDSLPFDFGEDMMDYIDEIKLEIDGIGEYIDISGTNGSAKIFKVFNSADSITPSGFAKFNGPRVFPSVNTANVKINISPVANSLFDVMETDFDVELIRNKKIIVTLWISATFSYHEIEIDIDPIETERDGDIGIWE